MALASSLKVTARLASSSFMMPRTPILKARELVALCGLASEPIDGQSGSLGSLQS